MLLSGRSPGGGNKNAEIFGSEETTKAKKFDRHEALEKFFGRDFSRGYS